MKKKIDALAYSSEIAQALKKAAVVTTKRGDKVNSMAIGWGHIGRIWERPSVCQREAPMNWRHGTPSTAPTAN